MKCRICNSKTNGIHRAELLNKYEVQYFQCPQCGFIQTEEPYWLEQEYSCSTNCSDTGIMARNIRNVRHTVSMLLALGKIKGTVVDFAGGYGILVRLLRDYGVDALWFDPFCENLFAKGFEYDGGETTLVTSFEAFEHFVEPIQEIENIFRIAPNLIFSTEIVPTAAPPQREWRYYGCEHGQHIGFYRVDTIGFIAKKYKKYLLTDGRSIHILTEKKISPLAWRIIHGLNRPVSLFCRSLVSSRTLPDHLHIVGKNGRKTLANADRV